MQTESDCQNSEKTAVKHIDSEEQAQTTFRVSTPPLNSSPMSMQKPHSNGSRLQLEFTTFETETQNTSGPYG